MPNNTPTEHEEQCQLFSWAWLHVWKYKDLGLMYAIPNGGLRNQNVARKLKQEGVKPGIPDIHLPVGRGGHFSLYIEMKRQKGGQLTMHQKDVIERLRKQNHRVEVCKGWEAARDVLERYLNDPRTAGVAWAE